MIKEVILFAVGLVLLIKGGDWFVDGAAGLAKRFHIPEILIGATVVSIGTTLPEVMVSSIAAAEGSGDIAYGNAIGSVICNTALIAAITVAIKPGEIDKKSLKLPVAFFYVSAAIYLAISYYFKTFSRLVGVLLLIIFAAYMVISSLNAKKSLKAKDEGEAEEESKGSLAKELIFLIIGAAFIAVGAKLLVDNGQKIAEFLGVPESVIALTFVALGTSLPELVTAITSLAKGHGALSLGNIVGANFFNLALVSGAAITISPFKLPAGKQVLGFNSSLLVELPVMMAVMSILCIPALIRGKLSRFQGILLLLIYAAFCAFQFVI